MKDGDGEEEEEVEWKMEEPLRAGGATGSDVTAATYTGVSC